MEEEQHLNETRKSANIFTTTKGRMLAAGVGIASLLTACNFDTNQPGELTSSHEGPVTATASIEAHHLQDLDANNELIKEWQEQVKKRLAQQEPLLQGEEAVTTLNITTGLNLGEQLEIKRNGGILVTGYAGQLPDLSSPPSLYKIFPGSTIKNGIVRQGINMVSSLTGKTIDRKFAYFNCNDLEGEIVDLNDQPISEIARDGICVVPLDFTSYPTE